MKTSDLQKKHIFCKEHLVEVPFSPLSNSIGMMLKGSETASVLEAEGRMTNSRAFEKCVFFF